MKPDYYDGMGGTQYDFLLNGGSVAIVVLWQTIAMIRFEPLLLAAVLLLVACGNNGQSSPSDYR